MAVDMGPGFGSARPRETREDEMTGDAALREEVRARYADSARAVEVGAPRGCDCCGTGSSCGDAGGFGAGLYGALDREGIPDAAVLASLGCGNPLAVADLNEGEIVLDLGSGGGIDVLLSAKRVGPAGKVYGLDMTEEMLALALRNREEAGATNVEFLKGYIEDIPLPAGTVDVVISNCVINLSTDKRRVFDEMSRVLKPGGRIGITDVVAEDGLSPADRAERGTYVGCIAGALTFSEYEEGLRAAGFVDVSVRPTHQVAEGMHSAIVKAIRSEALKEGRRKEVPLVQQSCC
jgi:arsenite methyltransferase